MGTQVSLPILAHICCGQMARCIKMPLGRKVSLDPSDIVLDGNPAPPLQKGDRAPRIFDPCLLWSNCWIDQDATWYDGKPWPGQHCVRYGAGSNPQEAQLPPQISARVCCGQTAGWIEMPLGMKVGLDPSRIVLHGDPAPPPKKGHTPPQFSAHVYCGQTVDLLSYC